MKSLRRQRQFLARIGTAVALLALGGCGSMGGMFAPPSKIKVEELGRASFCSSRLPEASVQLVGSAAQAVVWQRRNEVDLSGSQALPEGFYVVVEMGYHQTGGYGFVVSPYAEVRDSAVRLIATFVEPQDPQSAGGEPSSPCVLLRLPSGNWNDIDLRDPTGKRRARKTGSPDNG